MIEQVNNSVIERCKVGDIKAFKAVYERYNSMLYSIAYRMLHSHEDAEDALQNSFSKLYQSVSQYNGKALFSSYLVRIVINSCYDLLKKRRINSEELTDFELVHEENDALKLSLESAINHLPDKMRACFVLFAVEGFKQREIAEMLELQEGTVKAHVAAAKIKLQKMLAQV